MQILLALALLGSLGLYVWGLISPTSVSKALKHSVTRSGLAKVCMPLILLLFGIIGATAPPQTKQHPEIPIRQISSKATSESTGTVKGALESHPSTATQTKIETEIVSYESKTVPDPTLTQGANKRITQGLNGVRTKTYEITLSNGAETARKLLGDEITQQPVAEVTAVGTKTTPPAPAPAPSQSANSNCNPNYSGCVPNASDVDCAGGSGNGPAYVSGPVQVIGVDVYRLDGNNNGIGCE
jgi:hypothetical protein